MLQDITKIGLAIRGTRMGVQTIYTRNLDLSQTSLGYTLQDLRGSIAISEPGKTIYSFELGEAFQSYSIFRTIYDWSGIGSSQGRPGYYSVSVFFVRRYLIDSGELLLLLHDIADMFWKEYVAQDGTVDRFRISTQVDPTFLDNHIHLDGLQIWQRRSEIPYRQAGKRAKAFVNNEGTSEEVSDMLEAFEQIQETEGGGFNSIVLIDEQDRFHMRCSYPEIVLERLRLLPHDPVPDSIIEKDPGTPTEATNKIRTLPPLSPPEDHSSGSMIKVMLEQLKMRWKAIVMMCAGAILLGVVGFLILNIPESEPKELKAPKKVSEWEKTLKELRDIGSESLEYEKRFEKLTDELDSLVDANEAKGIKWTHKNRKEEMMTMDSILHEGIEKDSSWCGWVSQLLNKGNLDLSEANLLRDRLYRNGIISNKDWNKEIEGTGSCEEKFLVYLDACKWYARGEFYSGRNAPEFHKTCYKYLSKSLKLILKGKGGDKKEKYKVLSDSLRRRFGKIEGKVSIPPKEDKVKCSADEFCCFQSVDTPQTPTQ